MFAPAIFLSFTLLLSSTCVTATLSASNTGPVVQLSYGSFQGNATADLEEFLGIPFAAPPVGNLRFAPPEPPLTFSGVRQTTSFGMACPQQAVDTTSIPGLGSRRPSRPTPPSSEDCLSINIVKPAKIPAGIKLPVLFWIYGGAFLVGDTSTYPGNSVVARSIALDEPVIYVSANYRLNALGFLGGKEAKAAGIGNAGLRDQRFALEWIQKHIAAFGGDPNRVTIWGESAGAMSIGLHLVMNDGNSEGLFHGAFMQSGSARSLQDITAQQPAFDQLVANTECTGSADLIACLRNVPFDTLMTAINKSPNIFSSTTQHIWHPSVDGHIIARNPYESIRNGLHAKVPLVSGVCDDEGTMFSFANMTNNAEFLEYIKSNYYDGLLTTEQLTEIGLAYPDDITKGSPFDTGTLNAIKPEFKRLAAIQGDILFQAPRRFLLENIPETQPAYAFLFKRGKSTPVLGSFHASDIPEFFGSDILGFGVKPGFIGTDALVNFVNTGNPTLPHNPISLLSAVDWQPWSSSADHPLLTFLDPAPSVSITFDNFRVPEINLLNKLFLHFASGSLDSGLMNEAVTDNSDDKADTGYILRSDEEL